MNDYRHFRDLFVWSGQMLCADEPEDTAEIWTLDGLKGANAGKTICQRCGERLQETVFFQDVVFWCPACEKGLS